MKKGESMYKLKVPVADSKVMGVEPIWSDDYVPTDYQSEYGKALSWYNLIADPKDCRAFLADWFKGDTDKLKALGQISDRLLPRTYANSARIAMRGFPLNDEHKSRIWEKVEERVSKKIALIDDDAPAPEPVVKVVKKPLIVTSFIVSDVDDEIENLINGEDTRNIAQILSSQVRETRDASRATSCDFSCRFSRLCSSCSSVQASPDAMLLHTMPMASPLPSTSRSL